MIFMKTKVMVPSIVSILGLSGFITIAILMKKGIIIDVNKLTTAQVNSLITGIFFIFLFISLFIFSEMNFRKKERKVIASFTTPMVIFTIIALWVKSGAMDLSDFTNSQVNRLITGIFFITFFLSCAISSTAFSSSQERRTCALLSISMIGFTIIAMLIKNDAIDLTKFTTHQVNSIIAGIFLGVLILNVIVFLCPIIYNNLTKKEDVNVLSIPPSDNDSNNPSQLDEKSSYNEAPPPYTEGPRTNNETTAASASQQATGKGGFCTIL